MATTVNNPGVVYDWAVPGATTVVGPGSATDNAIALFDGTTGKLIKNSTAVFSGSNVTFAGNITAQGATHTFGANALASDAYININAAAGQVRYARAMTGGVVRWSWGASNSAESGSDAGSNFQLNAWTDAGAAIDSPISITRNSNGTITLGGSTSRMVATTGGRIKKITTFTDTATLSSIHHHVRCNKSTAMTINLPAASTAGREYFIKNVNTGVVTIDANGSELIDGALTYVLSAQYQSVHLMSDGTGWGIY